MEQFEYKRDRTIKDISDPQIMENIIRRCKTCHVSFVDGERPYGLTFCFGYDNNIIYLHTAISGKKLELLHKNDNVSVFFETDHELFFRDEHVACSWRMRYRSVIAYGKAEIVDDYDEKVKGLEIFMKNYSEREFTFSKPSVEHVNIIMIKVESMTGRSFEYIN